MRRSWTRKWPNCSTASRISNRGSAIPKALIVPHAGYIYSGPVAARAYDELAAARGIIKRVVLIGPSHYVAGRGLALPECDAFETPLGRVRLDAEAIATLADLKQVVRSSAAHAQEHSLEVQLPFLQKVLGDFSLVPIAAGAALTEEVMQVIVRLWGGPETLFVISTDLSHYHSYDEAKRIDGATLERIEALAVDLNYEEACGATGLNGLLAVARSKGLSIRQLAACNSGDTAGGKDRVVGYSAFAVYEGEAPRRRGRRAHAHRDRAGCDRQRPRPELGAGEAQPPALAAAAGRDLRHPAQGRPAARLHRQPVGDAVRSARTWRRTRAPRRSRIRASPS